MDPKRKDSDDNVSDFYAELLVLDQLDQLTTKQTKKRKAAITTISTPPSTAADSTFQFNNGNLNNLDNLNNANGHNETNTILQSAMDSSGLLTSQTNNNQPMTSNQMIINSQPIDNNSLDQGIHVDKKEFVEYQNLTNRNINRMIEVGDDHKKNSDTIESLNNKVKKLEEELSSAKAKLNIAYGNGRITKSELLGNKPASHKKKKATNSTNNEASTQTATASKPTGNKKTTSTSTNASNQITTTNSAPENCKVVNTVTTISSLANIPSSNVGSSGLNNSFDTNNNILHYRNLQDSGLTRLHPTSKYIVESEHLIKCCKSQTYTAFVCRILTSLVSVEETFMRTCKGGHSVGIHGLKKQSFSEACYQELLNAVSFYFPTQICNIDYKSWTALVSRSINTKLFQMNKHYQFLMGYPINNKYKLNETDIKYLRNYQVYLKDPRLFENLLIEMYGKDALTKPADNVEADANSLDDEYAEDHEYQTIESQLNREQQLNQVSQAGQQADVNPNVNQTVANANLNQLSHVNVNRVNENQVNQISRELVTVHQLNANQLNQINANQLNAVNLVPGNGQETVEIDYNYFNLITANANLLI